MSTQDIDQAKGFSWYGVGLAGALAIIGYFLFTEHRSHVISFLPILLLLSCPLMHVFMHKGHGKHRHGEEKNRESK